MKLRYIFLYGFLSIGIAVVLILPLIYWEGKVYPYYYYSIEFNSDDNDVTFIIIPSLFDEDKPNDQIINKLDYFQFNYTIEPTIYGMGLNISFQNDFEKAFSDRASHRMLDYKFSLWNHSGKNNKEYFWVYSSSMSSIKYHWSTNLKNIDHSFELESYLEVGWQLVKVNATNIKFS
ncbi:MAG: hypothetical protein JSV49_05125 [Thermoplasmata archaeon]|nr:MAG: hypothetical protein JSV49_05125 [Thermoplasmata archaeon]